VSVEAQPLTSDLGSRAVLNSAFVLAARIVSRLVSLVVVLKLANYLGADPYGRYTSLVAYSALVSVLADFGLNTLYTREAARDRARIGRYLGNLLSGKVALAVLATVVLAAALGVSRLGDLIPAGAALLVLTTYANLLRNTFYAVGRLEFEGVAILGETVIQSGLILLGAFTGQHVAYFVWAYAASYGFTCAYCLLVIPAFRLATISLGFDLDLLRSWLKLAFPFALGFFLTNLYFRVDVPILQHFKSFQEVGWYQLAYKPFEALQFIPLAMQSVVYPVLAVYYRSAIDRLGLAYERFFKILVLLGWPLTVGTLVLTHPIGRLFRLFPESEPSLRILSLGIVFLFVNSAFTAMLYSIDRQDLFARVTGIAVVVNVVFNLASIPSFGYLAASANTVLTEAAFSIAAWWMIRHRHRLPWFRLSWRIIAAGAVMGVVLLLLASRSVFIAVPIGLLVYAAALGALHAVDREELDLLRRGLRLRR
jgi:O-antigen/teichoic acid export membrane protein